MPFWPGEIYCSVEKQAAKGLNIYVCNFSGNRSSSFLHTHIIICGDFLLILAKLCFSHDGTLKKITSHHSLAKKSGLNWIEKVKDYFIILFRGKKKKDLLQCAKPRVLQMQYIVPVFLHGLFYFFLPLQCAVYVFYYVRSSGVYL